MGWCSWIQARTASGTILTLQQCRQKSNSSAKPCSPALLDSLIQVQFLRVCSFKQESLSFTNPLHVKCILSQYSATRNAPLKWNSALSQWSSELKSLLKFFGGDFQSLRKLPLVRGLVMYHFIL